METEWINKKWKFPGGGRTDVLSTRPSEREHHPEGADSAETKYISWINKCKCYGLYERRKI